MAPCAFAKRAQTNSWIRSQADQPGNIFQETFWGLVLRGRQGGAPRRPAWGATSLRRRPAFSPRPAAPRCPAVQRPEQATCLIGCAGSVTPNGHCICSPTRYDGSGLTLRLILSSNKFSMAMVMRHTCYFLQPEPA